MREEIDTITNGPIVLEITRLCSAKNIGDFEVAPFKNLKLDLDKFSSCYRHCGYDLNGMDSETCLFKIGEVEVTLFCDGRIVLERIVPDEFGRVMEFVEKIYNPPGLEK